MMYITEELGHSNITSKSLNNLFHSPPETDDSQLGKRYSGSYLIKVEICYLQSSRDLLKDREICHLSLY